jgi:hypothetical protein
MTDFELAYLATETRGALAASFSIYVSILFAFLVVSALAAQRMSLGLSIISNAMFAAFSLISLSSFTAQMWSLAAVLGRMKRASLDQEGDLAWYYLAQVSDERFIALTYVSLAAIGATVFGAIYFFFLCRRRGFRLMA